MVQRVKKRKVIIRGMPASAGVAQGKVKKIVFPYDFSGFKQGSVLVTEMTNPLFIPVIKKASAIVTDIGGVLCHAAIVSREYGIPCIVNTEKATTVLKDRQQVIVDATKGEIYAAE